MAIGKAPPPRTMQTFDLCATSCGKQVWFSKMSSSLGIELFVGENHNGKVEEPYIEALVMDKPDSETVASEIKATSGPLTFRKVRVKLTLNEFLGLFKRFSVTISPSGFDLIGRDYVSY
jgi:hypothetical protein